jgi:aminoglycoside phosphotransferase (APT) family kinase protein
LNDGGLRYELAAHARARQLASEGIPESLGAAGSAEELSLFFECLDDPVPVNRLRPQEPALYAAVTWIAHLHRVSAEQRPQWVDSLNGFDAAFLAQWPERATTMIREVAGRFGAPFDAGLVAAAGPEAADVVALLEADPVFVHGDFFPSNVVGSGATMWTLDWELAAAGPGEFDLAAFVFGWPDDIANEYTSQYVRTRWPSDHPTNFEMRFEAARRLLLMRILSVAPRDDRVDRHFARARLFVDSTELP